jgi:hypothetical protein
MATNMACQMCCGNNHTTGYDTFANALVMCGCATGGPCVTDCGAAWCAAPTANPSTACVACLNGPAQVAADGGAGACDMQIAMACRADPDCVALNTCAMPCAGKP